MTLFFLIVSRKEPICARRSECDPGICHRGRERQLCQRGGDPPCDAFGGGKNHCPAGSASRRGVIPAYHPTATADGRGEQFYRQCREALERIREAEETLQRGKDEVQGRLRVSLPVLFGQRCVAPLLFRLSQRYPLLKLELHYSDRQVNLLEEGFDLAVRIGSLADTGSLRARALGEHGMVLCAAAEYLRQQPAPQTIAGLNEHRTLGYLHNGQLQKWQLYDPQQGEVRFSPQTWLIQDDFAAIAAAVQQGMGIAWLPDWLVAQALADGTLQQVLAPSAQVRFAIHAVWPEGPWLPQKTRAAIDALREGLPLTATPG